MRRVRTDSAGRMEAEDVTRQPAVPPGAIPEGVKPPPIVEHPAKTPTAADAVIAALPWLPCHTDPKRGGLPYCWGWVVVRMKDGERFRFSVRFWNGLRGFEGLPAGCEYSPLVFLGDDKAAKRLMKSFNDWSGSNA